MRASTPRRARGETTRHPAPAAFAIACTSRVRRGLPYFSHGWCPRCWSANPARDQRFRMEAPPEFQLDLRQTRFNRWQCILETSNCPATRMPMPYIGPRSGGRSTTATDARTGDSFNRDNNASTNARQRSPSRYNPFGNVTRPAQPDAKKLRCWKEQGLPLSLRFLG